MRIERQNVKLVASYLNDIGINYAGKLIFEFFVLQPQFLIGLIKRPRKVVKELYHVFDRLHIIKVEFLHIKPCDR